MRVAYFVPDLSDPAVSRRVRMLQAGGADVVLFGFRRGEQPVATVSGAPTVDLGRTHDAKLASRALSVFRALLGVRGWNGEVAVADVLLARNLEMLVLAHAARRSTARRASLNYELLDIHRLLVSRSPTGACLRAIEGALLRETALTLVSSAAFVTNYFQKWARPVGQVKVVENKVLDLSATPAALATRSIEPPWRIGWYGMIRCRRSLELLCGLAIAAQGLVQIDIRGRPSQAEFADFAAEVARVPNLSFGGAYNPAEIPQLYGSVHFAWAVDFYEEGLNSSWLLPNRLYEGQLFGAVPIALRGVETGKWLAQRAAGLLFDDLKAELLPALRDLSPQSYEELAKRTADIPLSDLTIGRAECEALVRALGGVPT